MATARTSVAVLRLGCRLRCRLGFRLGQRLGQRFGGTRTDLNWDGNTLNSLLRKLFNRQRFYGFPSFGSFLVGFVEFDRTASVAKGIKESPRKLIEGTIAGWY